MDGGGRGGGGGGGGGGFESLDRRVAMSDEEMVKHKGRGWFAYLMYSNQRDDGHTDPDTQRHRGSMFTS